MTLVTTKEMLLKAQKGQYAVGAFNVENMEMIQAVIAAAEEMKSPVILQTTPSTVKYASPQTFYGMVSALAKDAKVPIALHLDHGNSFDLAMQAIRVGYTSVMIDGSHYSYEENIALTKKTVEVCQAVQVPVEAELGKVGGKEDGLDGGKGGYTDVQEAIAFVERTHVDSLAVAIGTAHGVYKGEPNLDLDLLAELHKNISIPLVLHGTSGVNDAVVQSCVQRGICKVNYATDLRIVFSTTVREYLADNCQEIDPKKYSSLARDAVKNYVMKKMEVLNSVNKA